MNLDLSDWIDTGNGERSAVISDPIQAGNYKSLCVKPQRPGEFFFYVNGAFRGRSPTRRAAQKAAIKFAVNQLSN